jgi:KipI family sensor histidine kinase inhibitor
VTDASGGVRIERLGEAALLALLGDEVDPEVNARVHRAAARLRAERERHEGIGEPVPGYASLLAPFDPLLIEEADVRAVLRDAVEAAAAGTPTESSPPITIPVSYGGADGPDLADVASRTGLDEAAVVRLHASIEYHVFCVGFVPGFAYLGALPAALELPRRATPRVRVPAGSVAIAGRQTGIYPAATPGGWHLIGRTNLAAWDPRREPPALLAPGDRVRFEPA